MITTIFLITLAVIVIVKVNKDTVKKQRNNTYTFM